MPTIILQHTVKDYPSWKAGFDSDEARRNSMGAETLAVGYKAGEPSSVYAVMKVADISEIGKAMSDPEFQKVLADFGVLSTDVTILEN